MREACYEVRLLSRMQKMAIEHFLNGTNRTSFENLIKAKILVNSVKSGLFGLSKWHNSAVFKIQT